jgi:hypothetical protein
MAQQGDGKQPETGQPEFRRRNWAAQVGGDATLAARTAFAKAGFADPTLVLRWREIAGEQTARIARPLKLSDGGVLTLKAEPAAATFLQHQTRALCARINSYLGRDAVTRLRFVQGPLVAPLPPPPAPPRAKEPPPEDPARCWKGPPKLGETLLNLARRRGR